MAHGASNSHEGVSCDGCMMPNFSGSRYKCLRCWDFDLCHQCYTMNRFVVDPASPNDPVHEKEHPMQCILSQRDFEEFYAQDDNRNYSVCRIVVLTCPYCNERGFSYKQFYEHVRTTHDEPKPYQVNCPLCIGLVDTDNRGQLDNLKQHWMSVHYQYNPFPTMQSSSSSITTTSSTTTAVTAAATTAAAAAAAPGAPAAAAPDAPTLQPALTRLNRAAAALTAAEATMAGAAMAGSPLDLPPMVRNGARRPMMARRAARQQQPGGAAGAAAAAVDRDLRTENREQRQQAAAAAAFGMPWTDNEDVQDLFRLVQRNTGAGTGAAAAAAAATTAATPPAHVTRMQQVHAERLRHMQAMSGPGGTRLSNADFIQRLMTADPSAASVNAYASLVSRMNDAAAAAEYASPRAAGAQPRSRTPPVTVVVGLGSRDLPLPQFDQRRRERAEADERSQSKRVSRDEEKVEAGEGEEGGGTESPLISLSSSSGDSQTKMVEKAKKIKNVDGQRTEEDDLLDALMKQQALAAVSLTHEEITDMRRGANPFIGKHIDPMTALRANATEREWKEVRRLLKNNDHCVRDEVKWRAKNDGSQLKQDEEGADSADEAVLDDLLKGPRPAAPKDEEDYLHYWLSVRTDSSGLAFCRDSYWKDKRFITTRKLERQSTGAVDDVTLTANGLKAMEIVRALAGEKVIPPDVARGLTQGEQMRRIVEMFDMRETEIEDPEDVKVQKELDQARVAATHELEYDFDVAILTAMRAEYEDLKKELDSRVGSPASASAAKRLEKQKQYLVTLRESGAGCGVVMHNPRSDPAEHEEIQRRLRELWGTEPLPPPEPPVEEGEGAAVLEEEEESRPL